MDMNYQEVKRNVTVLVTVRKKVPKQIGYYWGFYKAKWEPFFVQGIEDTGFYVEKGEALKIPVSDIIWHGPVVIPDFPRISDMEADERGLAAEALARGDYHPLSIKNK